MKHRHTFSQGFTIIEVVLVLAIAGLIFLMVFVALPSMQRSQRDSQRRSDMARLATALTNWQANNNGALPEISKTERFCYAGTSENAQNFSGSIKPNQENYGPTISSKSCIFIATYLNSNTSSTNEFKDPDGTTYGITFELFKTTPSDPVDISQFDHTAHIYKKFKCDNGQASSTGNPNDFAILYKLEGSGTVCVDNQ